VDKENEERLLFYVYSEIKDHRRGVVELFIESKLTGKGEWQKEGEGESQGKKALLLRKIIEQGHKKLSLDLGDHHKLWC